MSKLFAIIIAFTLNCFTISAQAQEKFPATITEGYIGESFLIVQVHDRVGANGKMERHLAVRGTKNFVLGETAIADPQFTKRHTVKLYFVHRGDEIQPYLCSFSLTPFETTCHRILRSFDD